MKDKNWIGNDKSVYSTLGANNHSNTEREKNDYYATDPKTIPPLFDREQFNEMIWECACGEGYLSAAMKKIGKEVFSTDIIDRGYEDELIDFLKTDKKWEGDIITNPPYKFAKEFVEKAIDLISEGNKVAMFLKIQFLEGQKRRELFDKCPPKIVYVFSKRQSCAMNGDFKNTTSSAVAYAWYVWEK